MTAPYKQVHSAVSDYVAKRCTEAAAIERICAAIDVTEAGAKDLLDNPGKILNPRYYAKPGCVR